MRLVDYDDIIHRIADSFARRMSDGEIVRRESDMETSGGYRGAGVWYPPVIAPTYEFRDMFVDIESDECAYNKDIIPFTEDELKTLLTE